MNSECTPGVANSYLEFFLYKPSKLELCFNSPSFVVTWRWHVFPALFKIYLNKQPRIYFVLEAEFFLK